MPVKQYRQEYYCGTKSSLSIVTNQREKSMQLNVSGHHLEVTDSLRNYVSIKLERLERHFGRITKMNVILSVEKQRQKAESTIQVSGGEIYADAEHDDLYAAIDMLADKLDRQIIKKKEKTHDRKHRSAVR